MSQRHSTLLPAHLAVSSLLFPLSYHTCGHCLSSSFPWTLECQAVKPLKPTCIWKVFPVQPYYLNCLILGFISDNGSGFVPFERKRANDHSLLYLLWPVSPEELKACNLLSESVLFNQFIYFLPSSGNKCCTDSKWKTVYVDMWGIKFKETLFYFF